MVHAYMLLQRTPMLYECSAEQSGVEFYGCWKIFKTSSFFKLLLRTPSSTALDICRLRELCVHLQITLQNISMKVVEREAEARQSGKMFVFFETPDVLIGSGCGAKEALVSIKYKFFYSPACFSFFRLRPWSTFAVYAFNLTLVLFFSGKRRDTFAITIYRTAVTRKTR